MKHIPDDRQMEDLLQNLVPDVSQRLDARLATAPWTPHAVARRRLMNVAAVALMIFALLVAVTPQGRAWAQQFLGFFSTAERIAFPATPVMQTTAATAIVPVASAPTISASNPDQCGTTISPTASDYACQLKAAEARLGFDIKVFSKSSVKEILRSNLNFTSLAADPSTQSVRLIFFTPQGVNLWLTEGLGDFPPARGPWEVVPQGAVQAARVGKYPAEYLKGDFVVWAGSQEFTWETEVANTQRLRWKEGERWFELRSMGGREISGPFEQADLIALAENLVSSGQETNLVAGTPSPSLEERAGFHIKQPTVVPKGFQLCHADYDAGYDGPTAFLSYCDNDGNSLVIDQILVARAAPYDFAERFGEPITVTPVQIGSVTGYHVIRGDGIQALMWEADGVRTQIVFQWDTFADSGKRIDQAGLLAIAESMR